MYMNFRERNGKRRKENGEGEEDDRRKEPRKMRRNRKRRRGRGCWVTSGGGRGHWETRFLRRNWNLQERELQKDIFFH